MNDYESDKITLISEWPPPDDVDDEAEDEEEDIMENSNHRKREPSIDNEKSLKRHKPNETAYESVDKIVASWYRKQITNIQSIPGHPPIKSSPRTKLNFAISTPEGQAMLTNKLKQLAKTDEVDRGPLFYQIMAGLNDKVGDIMGSLISITKCLEHYHLDPEVVMRTSTECYLSTVRLLKEEERNALWLYSKLSEEIEMRSRKEKTDQSRRLTVERLDYTSINSDEFKRDFCRASRPVVFYNVPKPTKDLWTIDYIRDQAGDSGVELRTSTSGSSEWAGLEISEYKTVSRFLDSNSSSDYLFDWSLPLNARKLHDNFQIPHLMSDNFLHRTSSDAMYHNSWPSLFIAKSGISSLLHIDSFSSHFWMYLISGKKRWTFYPPESAAKLNPKFLDSMDPVFKPVGDVDSYNLDLTEGELLFVPCGSPHKVDNIENSIAVSGNFVNETNLKEVIRHFKINSLLDPQAEELLKEFVTLGFTC